MLWLSRRRGTAPNLTCIREDTQWIERESAMPKDGKYAVYARYATPWNPSRSFILDGASPGPDYDQLRFPCAGDYDHYDDKDTWAFEKLGPPLALKAGKHRFRMTYQDATLHVDYFVIVGAR